MTSAQETASPIYLVGIDGSDQSRDALIWACRLAERTGALVHAVTAWRFPPAAPMPVVGSPLPSPDVFERAAQRRLDDTIEASGMEVADRRLAKGHPALALIELSAEYDLVVVGRTGRGRIARMLIGSTARHVAKEATCPVAIVDGPELFDEVVVAVDGSDNSIASLRWAAPLASDVEVTAIYSHDERFLDELAFDSTFRRNLDQLACAVVDRSVAESGVDPEAINVEIRSGDPRTMIVDAIEGELLVLGGCGQGLLARLIGSLANYAIGHTSGPVVIWRG
ncbi:MAG: universal stress protein [Actinomycetota bacterium]